MSDEYEIRNYEKGDEEEILELLDNVFNGWPHLDISMSPVEFWRWKYFKNPVHSSFISLAESGGKIVACHHNSVVKLKVLDETILGTAGQDLAVHPDFRGMAISHKVGDLNKKNRTDAGIPFSFFLTRSPVLIRRYRTSDKPDMRRPRFPIHLINMTRIRDIDFHFNQMPMENQFLIKNGILALQTWNKIAHSKKLDKKIDIIERERFSDEIDEFLDRLQDDYKFMFIRTSDYLNWKYSSPGIGKYTKFIAKRGQDIVGYIVLRANSYNKDYPIGYIVDLVTEPNHKRVASELICRAVEYYDKQGVNIINFLTVDKHPYIQVLKGFGFINSRISMNLYTSQERPECIEALKETDIDPSKILVSWGDHDVLPVGIEHH